MRYRFNEFEFDSTSLVLKKNGQTLAIRHNEAKVLKLLIEQPDNVLSKEDILSHVWQDKVVSEQAVFQNISHLRSLFGNQAIKTFSKRGYQWQLNVDAIHADTRDARSPESVQSVISANIASQQVNLSVKAKAKNYWLIILGLIAGKWLPVEAWVECRHCNGRSRILLELKKLQLLLLLQR